jgi:hypothetical protein
MKRWAFCAMGGLVLAMAAVSCSVPRSGVNDDPGAPTGGTVGRGGAANTGSTNGAGGAGGIETTSIPNPGDSVDAPQSTDQQTGSNEGCGKPCAVENKPCRTGILDCSVAGNPVCTEAADAPNGKECGPGMFCGAGACVPCSDGMPCTPATKCHQGSMTCGGPSGAICTDKNVNAPDGTACDGSGVCGAGVCLACGPTTAPICEGKSRKECVAGEFKTTPCDRGCAAGQCCPAGKEAVGEICVDCGGENQPCCKTAAPACGMAMGCMNDRCVLLCGPQTACSSGDGCCPPGGKCSAVDDGDCVAKCGNMIKEQGEMCDPCPTAATCKSQGCNMKILRGTGCNVECVESTQSQCKSGDGCCPSNCNNDNDSDCPAKCGNGVVEKGETCDGNCPTNCPDVQCQMRDLQGSAQQCNAKCVDKGNIKECRGGDKCCPSGCGHSSDSDCQAQSAGSKCGAEDDCKSGLTCAGDGYCCPKTCFADGFLCQKGSCVIKHGDNCGAGASNNKCEEDYKCLGTDGHCSNDLTISCTSNSGCTGGKCDFAEMVCRKP